MEPRMAIFCDDEAFPSGDLPGNVDIVRFSEADYQVQAVRHIRELKFDVVAASWDLILGGYPEGVHRRGPHIGDDFVGTYSCQMIAGAGYRTFPLDICPLERPIVDRSIMLSGIEPVRYFASYWALLLDLVKTTIPDLRSLAFLDPRRDCLLVRGNRHELSTQSAIGLCMALAGAKSEWPGQPFIGRHAPTMLAPP